MKKLAAIIILVAALGISASVSAASLDLANADSCILIDSKTGMVLYSKDPDRQRVYPASTTKIMTAILALEKGSLDQVMTASQAAINDIGKDGAHIGIMAGEEIRLENLLEAMLIRSANETANIIAENISPTREKFIELMNSRAKELGAENTQFTNTCGAHDGEHYTTASDLAKITRHAMTLPKFREIVAKKQFLMPPTNKHAEWPVLASTNNLLKYTESDLYTINGIKTGFTVPAGQCLVSSAINSEGMELISVVLGVREYNAKNNIIAYSKSLLDYGFENYALKNLIEPGAFVDSIAVENSLDDEKVQAVSRQAVRCISPPGTEQWQIEKKVVINPSLKAPIAKGDVLGYIEFSAKDTVLGKSELLASSDVAAKPGADAPGQSASARGASILGRVIIYTSIVLLFFGALRITLRCISRRVRSVKRLE